MTSDAAGTSRRHLLAQSLTLASAAALPGLAGCRRQRGTASAPPSRSARVELQVDGDSLQPQVELRDGSKATVSWIDVTSSKQLGTGTTPNLAISDVTTVGMTVQVAGRDAFDEVVTLNLGFEESDDKGHFSIGAAYNREPQPVTSTANVTLLTRLVRFCAGNTRLRGALDLSGLNDLEFVECFGASLDAINVSQCSSLIRLCVEGCRLRELDLNPVRKTLRDLRAAVQRSATGSLTFAALDGPMESLYHYCVRDQQVRRPIPHSQLPVLEQYWAWNTHQRTCDEPTSRVLTSYLARDNPLDQSSVDRILYGLSHHVSQKPGRVDLAGRTADGQASPPSGAGRRDASTLLSRGWRVSTNR